MHRFSRMNSIATCRGCGRRTHSSIDGCVDIAMCRACYEAANMENEHSDGHHDGAPDAACRDCLLIPGSVAPMPRVAAQNGGDK